MKNKTPKSPKTVEISEEEFDDLQSRLKNRALQESDYELISGALHFLVWLQLSLKEAQISIGRLRKLFGFSAKRNQPRSDPKDYNKNSSEEDESEPAAESTENSEGSKSSPSSGSSPKKKGHGRNPHTAYWGAPTIPIALKDLKPGDSCPLGCSGKVGSRPPAIATARAAPSCHWESDCSRGSL